METLLIEKQQSTSVDVSVINNDAKFITGWKAQFILRRFHWHILKLAIRQYGFSSSAMKVVKALIERKALVHGKEMLNKWAVASGKYYFFLYAPGFYSTKTDEFITGEMYRIIPVDDKPAALRFIFLAITKKCPMKCEHCFEWDNINKKEVLSYEAIRQIILKLKTAGIVQLHLSGGEPMLRIDDIVSIAEEFAEEMEIWIVTSGFNCTRENILRLKAAGVTGIVVSLDHYNKHEHDNFRGFKNAFEWATNAICFAREADMIACASVCCTQSFTSKKNLFAYVEFAKKLGASFIQLLEPKAVGHYSGKNVKLSPLQLKLLTDFYETVNFSNAYRNYPIVMYHGYHQQRVGCFTAGNRALYVDTNADVMSCPFCHVSSGNLLNDDVHQIIDRMRLKGCADYGIPGF